VSGTGIGIAAERLENDFTTRLLRVPAKSAASDWVLPLQTTLFWLIMES